ncbi:MAG: signal recognition particle-docking protein FtsY [Planctomycetes bacterium]|nr:signal recognition particle-docking protein FtsY [Planctomycetota bacterium]
MGLGSFLRAALSKTRSLFSGIAELFSFKGKVDQKFLDELEKRLYLADVGTFATQEIVSRVKAAYQDKEVTGEMLAFVKTQLREMLTAPTQGIHFASSGPTVIMIAGVNGAGKTTSIAKLAKHCMDQKKKVMVAACDTFRAAAVAQLTIWSERLGCEIVKNAQGSDPASVAHDACEKAKARDFDVLIVDTAGRLHTQTNLMKELDKIKRIVSKQIVGAPHEVFLVLDATSGQNAITQAEMFKKTIDCTGIVLAKLDGTAKGGAIFGVKQKLNLPVKFVGLGEGLDDLAIFDPQEYVEKLFED